MEQKVVQKAPEQAKKSKPNMTGIPTQMKLDFERRSGLSFDDVRVHYNSDKPRKIGALAYTQGNQVHVGPSQERHLRHELGHVVQQKQGIVRPTAWVSGLLVNNSNVLELQADSFAKGNLTKITTQGTELHKPVIQMTKWMWNAKERKWVEKLKSGKPSQPPHWKGSKDGVIVDTTDNRGLKNRIVRAQLRRLQNKRPFKPRTRADLYMFQQLRYKRDGGEIRIETPYSHQFGKPYMARGWWAQPYVSGKNKPIKDHTSKGSTSYPTILSILDEWADESKNQEKKELLIKEMLNYLKTTDDVHESTMFTVQIDANVGRAANYLCAILLAEAHESRANPDGGKLARKTLRKVLQGDTFVNAFARFFPQSRKNGNRAFREVLEAEGSAIKDDSEVSDDSDDDFEFTST